MINFRCVAVLIVLFSCVFHTLAVFACRLTAQTVSVYRNKTSIIDFVAGGGT
jgi:hypothetical protein